MNDRYGHAYRWPFSKPIKHTRPDDEYADWFKTAPIAELVGISDLMPTKERFALVWIEIETGINIWLLRSVLEQIRLAPVFGDDPPYRATQRPKRSGGFRIICEPIPELKKIQKRITQKLLADCVIEEGVCGFSGGSVEDALTPHLQSTWIMKVDFKDAFPTVTEKDVMTALLREKFGWYTARDLAQLTTWDGILPQGAPTSPRLFDIVCGPFDRAMHGLARNYGATYTRYADNIFVSVASTEFPQALRQGVLKLIENRRAHNNASPRHKGPAFGWHKLNVIRMTNRTTVHALGLNIINGRLHNTREFKDRFRTTLHHLDQLLTLGMQKEARATWNKLRGMAGWARMDTLPPKCLMDYREMERRMKEI
jgi:hypothetical protein